MLRALFADFTDDPHAIVKWTAEATPRDFGSLAPRIADYAARHDAVGRSNCCRNIAAAHIDHIAARLVSLGAVRLALVGGLASSLRSWLSTAAIALQLVEPLGDALTERCGLSFRGSRAGAELPGYAVTVSAPCGRD